MAVISQARASQTCLGTEQTIVLCPCTVVCGCKTPSSMNAGCRGHVGQPALGGVRGPGSPVEPFPNRLSCRSPPMFPQTLALKVIFYLISNHALKQTCLYVPHVTYPVG
jgi:hypothetical protein